MNEENRTLVHPTLKEREFRDAVLASISGLAIQYGYEDGLRRAIDVLLTFEEDLLIMHLNREGVEL